MKYNSIGEQLIAKAKELDPNYKPDKFNDMSEAIDIILNNSGGGSKSVPPTLNLVDLATDEVRTTITEEEYNNLKNGLYNSINYYTEMPEEMYLQSKLISIYDDKDKSLNCIFSSIKITATSETDISSTNIIYSLGIGQKDTSGNYPVTIEKLFEIPFGSNSGGDNTIPTLETKRSYIDSNDTVYSDADIELIKKQENNFINLSIGSGNNIENTLCFVVKNKADSSGNSYILTAVGGWAVTLISSVASAPAFIAWTANMTTKKLTLYRFTGLSYDNTSLYVRDNKIFLTDTLTTQDPVNILHTYYVFDTINGKPIIHSDTAVNNYNIPTITFED